MPKKISILLFSHLHNDILPTKTVGSIVNFLSQNEPRKQVRVGFEYTPDLHEMASERVEFLKLRQIFRDPKSSVEEKEAAFKKASKLEPLKSLITPGIDPNSDYIKYYFSELPGMKEVGKDIEFFATQDQLFTRIKTLYGNNALFGYEDKKISDEYAQAQDRDVENVPEKFEQKRTDAMTATILKHVHAVEKGKDDRDGLILISNLGPAHAQRIERKLTIALKGDPNIAIFTMAVSQKSDKVYFDQILEMKELSDRAESQEARDFYAAHPLRIVESDSLRTDSTLFYQTLNATFEHIGIKRDLPKEPIRFHVSDKDKGPMIAPGSKVERASVAPAQNKVKDPKQITE